MVIWCSGSDVRLTVVIVKLNYVNVYSKQANVYKYI